MQIVDLNEMRQPKGVKLVNGIVLADNFRIFRESEGHFSPLKLGSIWHSPLIW